MQIVERAKPMTSVLAGWAMHFRRAFTQLYNWMYFLCDFSVAQIQRVFEGRWIIEWLVFDKSFHDASLKQNILHQVEHKQSQENFGFKHAVAWFLSRRSFFFQVKVKEDEDGDQQYCE